MQFQPIFSLGHVWQFVPKISAALLWFAEATQCTIDVLPLVSFSQMTRLLKVGLFIEARS